MKDFLIGAPLATSLQGGTTNAGQVYVLYGQQNTTAAMGIWGSDFNLSTLISSPLLGRVIDGVAFNSYLGWSVSTAGDFNADGLSDVLIGAPYWNSNQGKAFVVFGKAKSQAITPLFLNNLSSNTAIEFVGESTVNFFGQTLSSGDWNSDGFVDLLIGAYGYSSNTGATYMIFGHNGTWVISTNASGVGTNVSGVKFIGDPGSYNGFSVSNGGDVNADSIDDHHWWLEFKHRKSICCVWTATQQLKKTLQMKSRR